MRRHHQPHRQQPHHDNAQPLSAQHSYAEEKGDLEMGRPSAAQSLK